MARPANVEDIRNYHKDLDAITKKYGDIQLPGVVTITAIQSMTNCGCIGMEEVRKLDVYTKNLAIHCRVDANERITLINPQYMNV